LLKQSSTSTVGAHSTRIKEQIHIIDPAAVERIKEYLEVGQEAPARVSNPPPAGWPSSDGGIVVQNLVIRYAVDLPAVLKGISFAIKPREKIGVVRWLVTPLRNSCDRPYPQVGRTGAGKVKDTL
jgi:ABC-type multidrug transport system fused ATPase/permease subunit